MKRKVRILELARVGKWGLDGSEITKQDIAELAQTIAGKRPVIIGHDTTDRAPKFGDVLDCWPSTDGCALAGAVMFSETADKLFEEGLYNGWSISMPRRSADGKRVLHHLAILGAVPPKIPGLEELAKVEVSFSDSAAKDRYQFSGQMKPEKEGNDTMTEEEKRAMAEMEAKVAKLEAENKTLTEQAEKQTAESPATEPEAPAATATDAGTDEKFADMQKQVDQLKAERRKERLEGFARNIAGKIPAGSAAKAKALAAQIEVVGSFDFSDDGKTVKKDALGLFEEIICGLPQPVRTGSSGIDYGDNADEGEDAVNWGAAAKKM